MPRLITAAAILALVFASLTAAQDRAIFTVGTATAARPARAPVTGVVLYVCAVPSMTKGATVANIGVVAR